MELLEMYFKKKKNQGKGSHLDPPNIYTMVTPLLHNFRDYFSKRWIYVDSKILKICNYRNPHI